MCRIFYFFAPSLQVGDRKREKRESGGGGEPLSPSWIGSTGETASLFFVWLIPSSFPLSSNFSLPMSHPPCSPPLPSLFSLCPSFDLISHPRFWRRSMITYLLPSFPISRTHPRISPGAAALFFTCRRHSNSCALCSFVSVLFLFPQKPRIKFVRESHSICVIELNKAIFDCKH